MGKIRVIASLELGIQARPEAPPAKEERVVPGQPPRSQVPYEVGRVLVAVVYPLSTKGNNGSISCKQDAHYRNTVYIPWTRKNEMRV